ncbi:hypothetical protein MLD38_029860 [Melastoma candidum]|uniref:Uncharacterized protein n=1 Tax=Melastoma candidum TaxID=119954 RepID=A0ACB9N5F0_9MYRT|nr:hypothetical protein MLD38_029860 [Melastoma candidum]
MSMMNNNPRELELELELEPPPPPPPPLQPHRPSTSCDLHPDEHFTGFCPSCLCERLSLLNPNNSNPVSSSSLRNPLSSSSAAAAASAIRSLFRPKFHNDPSSSSSSTTTSSALFPELRRSKSFSASKNSNDVLLSAFFEPQRKSCDVRARSTLWSLFSQDDGRNIPTSSKRNSNAEASRHSFVGVKADIFDEKEEEEEEIELTGDYKVAKENIEESTEEEDGIVIEECNVGGIAEVNRVPAQEIVEEEVEDGRKEAFLVEEALKTMKDCMDLDSHGKKSSGRDFKEIAGSFWSAASVFSKKWQKWRRKQKMKKQERGGRSSMLPVVKPAGRHFRETQSEVADYGFGRHSCDTDPRFSLDAARFSLDAGRMSLDDPRHSFEMPRASWDGYLIGRSSFQRMPTIASVVEDSPPPARVPRTDMQIPVEMPAAMNSVFEEDETIPGGSAQTRDYYLDSTSRRRKSLDRTNSIKKTAAAVVAEMDELKSVKNAKVTPATAEHYLQGTSKIMTGDKESMRDPIPKLNHSHSLRDDRTHMFDMAFHDSGFVIGNSDQKGTPKKSWRWGKGWNIWAFIHRRTGGGGHHKDIGSNGKYGRSNQVASRSFSESWQDLRGGEPNGFNRRVLRSNSSVSSRNSSYNFGGPLGGTRKNGLELNGKKRREELVVERNRSVRYSPNNVENGMLRFYLNPLRGSRRGIVNGGGGGSVKGRANHAHSIARSMLRMY